MIENPYFTGFFNEYVSKNNNNLNSEISHHLLKLPKQQHNYSLLRASIIKKSAKL